MLTQDIIRQFSLPGSQGEIGEIRSGLINATYRVNRQLDDGGSLDFIMQRINRSVFANAEAVMKNIAIVTRHLSAKAGRRPHLRLIPLLTGENYYESVDGDIWRCYSAIEKCVTYNTVETAQQAFEAGKAFGMFIHELSDLDSTLLTETIPGFHDTPQRYQTLLTAIEEDPHARLKDARDTVSLITPRTDLVNAFSSTQNMPSRIVHYDTKINNVMIDPESGEGVCVIDLDTVMPGLAVLDFGDLVRTAACTASEEETDLTKVGLELTRYRAIEKGFLEGTGNLLTARELESLPIACKLITLELAIRFLTDHLRGDQYFRIDRPNQNLDRARNQLTLLKSMEEQL